jgi:hypothetical protein
MSAATTTAITASRVIASRHRAVGTRLGARVKKPRSPTSAVPPEAPPARPSPAVHPVPRTPDHGFDEAHGYGPGHGGPSGPGDVPAEPAPGPAPDAPEKSGEDDDEEP